jgi:hypothetical protein
MACLFWSPPGGDDPFAAVIAALKLTPGGDAVNVLLTGTLTPGGAPDDDGMERSAQPRIPR